jgi:hypothetical protein
MPNGDEAFTTATEAPVPATEAPVPATEPERAGEPDPDRDFGAAFAATLQQFGEDLTAPSPSPEPLAPALAISAPEPPSPPAPDGEGEWSAAALYPGLAYDLNRQAEGLGPVWAPPAPPEPLIASHTYWEIDGEPLAALLDEAEPTSELDPASVAGPSRERRLEEAVRLTGQAIHAWLSVLQAPSLALDPSSDTLSR